MLHQKYKTLYIPRCRYLGSFVIPLASICTLLLLFGVCLIIPNEVSNTYALEAGGSSEVGEDLDTDIAALANTPSASLTISNPSLNATGKAGEVVSISSDISVSATLVNSYNLQISGSSTLTGPNNIVAINNIANPNGLTTSSMSDDTWGYSWNNNSSYKGISNTAATIDNTGVDSAGNVSYTKLLTFAAKFGKDAEAGHYTTSVHLSLIASPKALTTYTITYDANGGNSSTVPANQSCSTYNTSCTITISSTKPTRTNYTFLGWSTTNSATSATYQPSESMTLSSNITLYAVWKDGRTLANITTMQEMNKDICTNSSTGTTYTLTDSRDWNKYTVRKFNDNKCWMTSNLLLTGSRKLTSADSDVTSNYNLPQTLVSITSGVNFSSNYVAESYYYASSASTGNIVYYSWTAATAGAGGNKSLNSGYVNTSICPKEWRLPFSWEYQSLASAESISNSSTGSTKIRDTPYNFSYVGLIDRGVHILNNSGFWWSNTAYNTTFASGLQIDDNAVYFNANSLARNDGFAVRCIARN